MADFHELKLSREQNKLVRQLLENHATAQKNWIASRVEAEEFERAKELVKELRSTQELFHTFKPDEYWDSYTRD
jgi:hypothetical protein